MTWLTFEQLKSLKNKCCMCDKNATWLPLRIGENDAGYSYCDDHYNGPLTKEDELNGISNPT